ncbi:contact-dependent growth inhibition system immunity protein [Rhizobium sp. LjRoot30]|uniref:contact-dependent growth inhibition system immunity protein n=1 Tax=Rhizobium sp. LjRoot30 TaxID=3342320 RepID=UPI003ECCF8FC
MVDEQQKQSLNQIYGLTDEENRLYYPELIVEAARKPIDQLEPEEIRLLVGQQIFLEPVLPFAMAMLEEDPLADTEYYAGDLLSACIGIDETFWQKHPTVLFRLQELATQVLLHQRDSIEGYKKLELEDKIRAFLNRLPPAVP